MINKLDTEYFRFGHNETACQKNVIFAIKINEIISELNAQRQLHNDNSTRFDTIFQKLKQEGNSVGQVENILKVLDRALMENDRKNSMDVTYFINTAKELLKEINKPRTTDKEQPKSKCKCTEGFQDLCDNYIDSGPLQGHCSLNCTDNFRPLVGDTV